MATPDKKRPLVFISHDTRDADLATEFANLLKDASGGVVKTFRSSEQKGTAGIPFGAEWYSTIMTKLSEATDVVAILTKTSITRPWILYEIGYGKARLNARVFGIALDIPIAATQETPFGQLQNCADDEESLTKLVLQIIKKHPEASPRQEAIQSMVAHFRRRIHTLFEMRISATASANQSPDPAVGPRGEDITRTDAGYNLLAQKVEALSDIIAALVRQIRATAGADAEPSNLTRSVLPTKMVPNEPAH